MKKETNKKVSTLARPVRSYVWSGDKKVRVKLVRGTAGKTAIQLAQLSGLGLRKVGDEVIVKNDASIGGMVERISHLVEVTDA